MDFLRDDGMFNQYIDHLQSKSIVGSVSIYALVP